MAKKILIINKSFELGGIQMALANMLSAIHDEEEYDVSLAIFNPEGPFKDRIPENVKLVELSPLVRVLGMNNSDCKAYGTLPQKVFKVLGTAWSKLFGNKLPVSFAFLFQKKLRGYDVVISYHQETSAKTLVTGFGRFALEKCAAPHKISWVHADFLSTKLATKENLKTYRKFDKIVGVSKTCISRFIGAYPELKDKCDYCYNYISAEKIIEKAHESSNVFERSIDTVIMFSACRLVREKGIVPALENLLPVLKSSSNLKWYIAGDGTEKEKILRIIEENNIKEKVILLGYKANPYPYIKEADYMFLPSLHEAFSMVVGEAHILGTPVIASDIPIMQEILDEDDYLCVNSDFCKCVGEIMSCERADKVKKCKELDWKQMFKRVLDK